MSKQQPLPTNEWPTQRAIAFTEAGNMLRHYSSSRTAVLSLVLPVCLGILGWALSISQQRGLMIYLLIAEGLLFLYGVYLSIFFSMKYEQTRQFLVKIEAGETLSVYSSIVSSRLRGSLKLDAIDKSIVIVGLLLHIAYYVYYFNRHT